MCLSAASAAAKSRQSCPTLCNPVDCSTPGFPVHHQPPELAQSRVHRIGNAIHPSHVLSSPSLPDVETGELQSIMADA